ncbi:hypothetical protein IJ531_00140, partial [bacterium]|nr:hypothetical protein [bacterium]
PDINYDVGDFISSKLDTTNLTEGKVKKLIHSAMLDTWYWSYGQNDDIDDLIDLIEEKHITDYDEIDKLVSKCIDEHFINNEEFITLIHDRLIIQAYVAHLAKLLVSSAAAYSMCYPNPYFKLFITSLIDKSLYEYFLETLEEYGDAGAHNIFKRGKKSRFMEFELEGLLAQIEEKWS